MKIVNLVKLAVVAAAGVVIYKKVLNDEARATVKSAAQNVVTSVQGAVNTISGLRPLEAQEDATAAQTWAAEQWESVGFGENSK